MTRRPPSGRTMSAVWMCAVALATACMAGLLRIGEEPDPELKWLRTPPFALVIGTSLVRHAFPPELAAKDLFSQATNNDRIGRAASPGLTDSETIGRLERAIDAGVKNIFIEIDPLLRTIRPDQIPDNLRMLRDFSDKLRGAALQLLSSRSSVVDNDTFDPLFYSRAYNGNTVELALYYPVAAHPPRDPVSIAKALATARQRGLDVVWIAMPRSETAANYFGAAFEAAFEKQLQEFAAGFDATIWRPAQFWPNRYFVDQSHLNAAGRTRLLSEFGLYVATTR